MSVHALLFDFDGVLADSEPLHKRAFDAVLREEGQPEISAADYYQRYLHGDDPGVFRMVSADRGYGWDEARVTALAARKGADYLRLLQDGDVLYPGAAELVRRVTPRFPAAIVSMALRHEIELILRRAGLSACFAAIVAAGEVSHLKPDPEPYLTGLARLNRACRPGGPAVLPAECLVIEDSAGGVRAGKSAGMRVAALTHNLPAAVLQEAGADYVLDGLPALGRLLDAEGGGR